jgi:hypothetical protein
MGKRMVARPRTTAKLTIQAIHEEIDRYLRL